MNMSTAYQVREPRIHTLQSYINDEPTDYVKQNGTDMHDLQNINKLKNASETLQTAQSQALTNIPEDFDLDQFLKGSIAEINAQVVGVDHKNSKSINQDLSESPSKVYTQIKQPNCNVNNYLYGQNGGKPKVQTLDEILKQSISKMDYISEQCQQTIQPQSMSIDNNMSKQNIQNQYQPKQVDFVREPNIMTSFNNINQIQQKESEHQDDILKNVNFDFDLPTYNNLFDEKIINQDYQIQQNDSYDYQQQDDQVQQHNFQSQNRQNPRQRAINKTNDCNDSFQYIAHRIPSMRNETRESKVLKSQLQNKALQDEIAAIRQIQCEQSAQIAMQRKQIQSELKKYQKWMLQTFDIDIDKIMNQRENNQVQATLFNPAMEYSKVQQSKNQVNKTQSLSNRSSIIQKQPQQKKITPSAVRNRILQQSNISRSNSKPNNQYSQIKSQYSQQNLAKNGIKPKNQQNSKISRDSRSQPSSRASSRASSKDSNINRCNSQIQRSMVRSTYLNTPQSIKAGMRNNILNRQMEVVEPRRDDAIYYRQMLQKQLYQQKLEEQRKQKALQEQMEQEGQQYTFKPQINQRPSYLDQMHRFQKSGVQNNFYDQQEPYLANPPYLQNSMKQKNNAQATEYTVEQYEEDERYLEEQIKVLNSQLYQSNLASFRGRSLSNDQNVQYVNGNAIQNQKNYMTQQQQQKQQTYNQNTYHPSINKLESEQMTQGLKKYLETPVYDRLQNKSFNSRSNTPQKEQNQQQQQQKKMTTKDFQNFLARQTASQQKKMKNILLKQAETESDVIAKANMNKMNRQSQLYLKYRNLIGNSQKNANNTLLSSKNTHQQNNSNNYNSYQNKVLNNIYDIQIGEQRQFNGQIW